MKLLSSPLARPAQRSPVWDLDDLDRYGIPTESTTLVPRYLIPFRDWLCHQSTSLPAVLEEHVRRPSFLLVMANYILKG